MTDLSNPATGELDLTLLAWHGLTPTHRKDSTMIDTTTQEFTVWGLSIGHSCANCARLTITPAAIHTAGASFELVATVTAGDVHHEEGQRGSVQVRVDDIPEVVAELERIYDRAALAEVEQSIPADWPIHD